MYNSHIPSGERIRLPFLPYRPKVYRDGAKLLIDRLCVLISLPLILPLIALFALIVRRDGGPAFFGHTRIGRNGIPFTCWKLRSMVPEAEAALAAHFEAHPEAAAQWARDYKLKDDPRITPVGRILRRTSLDELPQLLNVLLGEMSLVGPRPVTAPELEKYAGYQWAYLGLRPGITGAWQISGRNDVTYAERVGMDVAYSSELTLLRDFRILLGTLRAVLTRTGR